MTAKDSYCRDLVARLDRDRFLCAQFAPAERRDALYALYAFNLEIAGVRESVSEPLVGQMRLKWWYDAVDAIVADRPPKHPVAVPLAATVARHRLARHDLEGLIEARSDDLASDQPATLADLEASVDRSATLLVRLVLAVLGVDAAAPDLSRAVGIAWALTGHLRAVPPLPARRAVPEERPGSGRAVRPAAGLPTASLQGVPDRVPPACSNWPGPGGGTASDRRTVVVTG